MTLPRIEILTTGGTIAGKGGSATGSSYQSGEVGGDELVASVPGLSEVAEISVRQVANIPSQDMTEEVWIALLAAIREDFGKFDGFVVTHGTDTMEETSFFLSLTVPSGKPVVLTGAMLPSTAVSADGPRNIFNAVCAAKSPAAAPYGVLVAMNGELFTARGLYKSKTVALDTFTSRLGGAVGWTQNGEAHFSVPAAPEASLPSFRESKLLRASALPRIAVLFTWAGADGTAASAYLDAGFQGLVTAGFGDGNIPKAMMPALEAAVRSGLPVVRSSRCAFGPVLEAGEVDDRKYGFVCGGALSAVQCRILLQLALFERPGATREDLQALFRRFAG